MTPQYDPPFEAIQDAIDDAVAELQIELVTEEDEAGIESPKVTVIRREIRELRRIELPAPRKSPEDG